MMDKVTVKGKRSALLALVVLILAVIPLSNYAQADRIESSDNKAFLPIVTYTISKGIYGQVSLGNMGPWADVALDLRFFNGAAWSTIASTMTDSDGIYSFKNVPSLQPGQRYYVRYLNTANQAFLYTWHTRPITVIGPRRRLQYCWSRHLAVEFTGGAQSDTAGPRRRLQYCWSRFGGAISGSR
jgi:hypothetical protein